MLLFLSPAELAAGQPLPPELNPAAKRLNLDHGYQHVGVEVAWVATSGMLLHVVCIICLQRIKQQTAQHQHYDSIGMRALAIWTQVAIPDCTDKSTKPCCSQHLVAGETG